MPPYAAASKISPRLETRPWRRTSPVFSDSRGAAAGSATVAAGAAVPRLRTSASSARASSSFSTRISASGFLPPADSSLTSATPTIRCSKDCCSATLWMRANGMTRRLRSNRPLRTTSVSPETP